MKKPLDFEKYKVLTFDCYGTLIDWEKGLLEALRPILALHQIKKSDKEILETYASIEHHTEEEYKSYKEVLREIVNAFGKRLGFTATPSEMDSLPRSIQKWTPFEDTVSALETLKKHYKLAVISNIDNDLFAFSAKHLQVPFDWITTAEECKSYKPSTKNFTVALGKLPFSQDQVLHVAQSLFHDIVPAKSLGLSTVWVNRRKGKEGFGATVPAHATPDVGVESLKELISLTGLH